MVSLADFDFDFGTSCILTDGLCARFPEDNRDLHVQNAHKYQWNAVPHDEVTSYISLHVHLMCGNTETCSGHRHIVIDEHLVIDYKVWHATPSSYNPDHNDSGSEKAHGGELLAA